MSKNALQLQESLQVTVCYLSAARYSLATEMHGDLKEALCYKLALEIHQASLNTARGVFCECVCKQSAVHDKGLAMSCTAKCDKHCQQCF